MRERKKKMSLDVPLLSGWKLGSDSHQFMLIRVNDNGREFFESYHSTIIGCLESLISKKIMGFNSTSIEILMKEIKSLRAGLSTALHPLKLVVIPFSELNKLKETQKSKI